MKISERIQLKKLPENVKLWIELRTLENNILQPSTETEITTIIGQRLQHIACSNVPISAVRWDIDNIETTVANYTVTLELGQKTTLTQENLISNPITFCWWRGGRYTVTCTVETASGVGQVSQSFNVTSPLVRDFNAKTGTVGVGIHENSMFIRLAREDNFNKDGIYMNAIVSGEQSTPGYLAGIQLASNQRIMTLAGDTPTPCHLSTNGQYILDTGMTDDDMGVTGTIWYQNHFVTIYNNRQNVIYEANDGPGAELNSSLINAMFIGDGDQDPTVPEYYQMYLMFSPDVAGAIWVPIKILQWGWEGYTTYSDNTWQPAQDTNIPEPVSSDPVDFPQWNSNTSQSKWVVS